MAQAGVISRDDPRIDTWLPDAAPSAELRRWYGHVVGRYEQFVRSYEQELETTSAGGLADLVELADRQPVTLVTATRDVAHSHAVVLARVLDARMSDGREPADVARLRRWEDAGGVWRVDAITGGSVRIAMCRCDGGEEVDWFTSSNSRLLAYVAGRGSNTETG